MAKKQHPFRNKITSQLFKNTVNPKISLVKTWMNTYIVPAQK